ncbi:hypothetical protein Hanom_Chr05g00405121 [Helianthus anomalus]
MRPEGQSGTTTTTVSNCSARSFSLTPPHILTSSLNSEQTLSHITHFLPFIILLISGCIGFSISDSTWLITNLVFPLNRVCSSSSGVSKSFCVPPLLIPDTTAIKAVVSKLIMSPSVFPSLDKIICEIRSPKDPPKPVLLGFMTGRRFFETF